MTSALLVWGGWDRHEPRQGAELFSALLRTDGWQVEVSDTLESFADGPRLRTFDLLVPIWTMDSISDAALEGLLGAVRDGVGLAGWHGCLADSFRDRTEYQFMVGGQWVAHPGNIIDYRVHITRPDDPIMAGLGDFAVHSEQYYMHVDPAVEVLATTTFSGEHAPWIDGAVMPVVWKKRYGAGRVFYCSLGHNRADFDVIETRTIIQRGMGWAARF